MRLGSDCLQAQTPGRQTRRHRLFLEYLVVFLALDILALLALLYVLGRIGSLPAPPITATYCIDEKFKFLAEQRDLRDSDLIAVGSSVTWRNLDMRPFVEQGVAQRPLNAAPCYLHMDQIAFLSAFLLDHLDSVEIVVSIVGPRDFADCNEADRGFFATDRAASYIFQDASPLWLYVTNFRPIPFLRDAWSIAEKRSSPRARGPLVMDPYGAGPIEGSSDWTPAPEFDDACFAALHDFEAMLDARGVRLVLVSFPSSPGWLSEHDPEGAVTESFEARLRGALAGDGSIFVPSKAFSVTADDYYDYVHLQWPAARRLSDRLAEMLAARRLTTSGG